MCISDPSLAVYPIGTYTPLENFNAEKVTLWIQEISKLPKLLREITTPLTSEFLSQPLRPGAWSIKQLIHHIADSHHHSYNRFKWALSEETPLIKDYNEKAWSILKDASAPISLSIDHLAGVHGKWVYLLKQMDKTDFCKQFQHPQHMKLQHLYNTLGLYAWHGNHHLAQLKAAIEKAAHA